MIEAGILKAQSDDEPCRHFTLTYQQRPDGTPVIQESFHRLRATLRGSEQFGQYACVVEIGDRPHLHVVEVGGRPLSRRRLQEVASRAGFGSMAKIQSVGETKQDAHRLARYVVKELPLYAKRSEVLTNQRFRPVRLSRKWFPAGLARAKELLHELAGWEKDPGPFLRFTLTDTDARLVPSAKSPIESAAKSLLPPRVSVTRRSDGGTSDIHESETAD